MTDAFLYFRLLKKKYLMIRSGELLLCSLGTSSVIFSIAYLLDLRPPFTVLLPTLTCAAFFFTAFFMSGLHRLKEGQFIRFINHNYPAMQQSADLLLMDPAVLTSLQRIQQEKIEAQFKLVYKSVRFPNRLSSAFLFFLTGLAFTLGVCLFVHRSGENMAFKTPSLSKIGSSAVKLPASIRGISIKIIPPAYTGLPEKQLKDPNFTMIAGSTVTWSILFSDSVLGAQIIFSGGDSASLAGGVYQTLERSFSEPDLYQISWQSTSGQQKFSEYYKIQVISDEPPKIMVPEQPMLAELDFNDQPHFDLKADVSDDYGLGDAYIVATVSKGSGESVKFREEKLRFASPSEIRGANVNAVAKIDLRAIGLTAGDELYFYVEALDNKTPIPNRARTETFVVVMPDTTGAKFSADAGMGADLMPEYFRSQRQIIIESEKLLHDKKGINKQTFNLRSNELGYDQKMLRLKYGEFLGEEFETIIGPNPEQSPDAEAEGSENPFSQYAHRHDSDNDHNLVPDKGDNGPHDHLPDSEKNDEPLEAYRHVHDDPEEATFFTGSIRAKLKAALALMWEAELHLRLSEPQKSLPYQYKALKLLKDISEASRIYVHKTGFEPPPLKEDKRLTGDLSEIRNSRHQTRTRRGESDPEIRAALSLVERELQRAVPSFTTKDLDAIFLAGNVLAARALEEPGKYLNALSAINSLKDKDNNDPISKRRILIVLRHALWTAIPKENISPAATSQRRHALDKMFIDTMQSQKK